MCWEKPGYPYRFLDLALRHAGKRLTHREAVKLFETALNAGVIYFDTAPEFAGYGKAQEQLGLSAKNAPARGFFSYEML